MTEKLDSVVLGHFATYRFTSAFWGLGPQERRAPALAWFGGLRDAAEAAHLYVVQGLESGADVLVWSSTRVREPAAAGTYFAERARVENAHRDVLDPVGLFGA